MRTKRLSWLAAAALSAMLASACGGDDGGREQVASLDGDRSTDTEQQTDEEATPEEAEAAFREFAQCMREHGVDMPDPQLDGEGGGAIMIGPGPDGGNSDASAEDLAEADKACQPLIEHVVRGGPGQLDPEEEAKMRDSALAFAKCMREHGVDMPDPTFSDGGMVQQEITGPGPGDDDFRAANEACAEELGTEGGPGFQIGGPIE